MKKTRNLSTMQSIYYDIYDIDDIETDNKKAKLLAIKKVKNRIKKAKNITKFQKRILSNFIKKQKNNLNKKRRLIRFIR